MDAMPVDRPRLNGTELLDQDAARVAQKLCQPLAWLAIDGLIQHFEETRRAPAAMTLRSADADKNPVTEANWVSCHLNAGLCYSLQVSVHFRMAPAAPSRIPRFGDKSTVTGGNVG